jgi:hypothetical protein
MAVRPIPADTSPEAFRVLLQVYRAMPPCRRLEIAMQMSDDILEVAASGVRQRHPDYNDEQVRMALIRMRRVTSSFGKSTVRRCKHEPASLFSCTCRIA